MIQVLKRAFQILELLDSHEGVSLDKLSRKLDLNKGTLCNILKTLTELGYTAKSSNGHYIVSPDFYCLALPYARERMFEKAAVHYSAMLAEQTRESGVVVILRENKLHIVAQRQYHRSLMVNAEIYYSNLSLYHSVSGRILLAFVDDATIPSVIDANGFPGEEWNDADNMDKLNEHREKIRHDGMAVMFNSCMEIKSFAVPVFDCNSKICASLGLTVPCSRLTADNESRVVSSLKDTALRMSTELYNSLLQFFYSC